MSATDISLGSKNGQKVIVSKCKAGQIQQSQHMLSFGSVERV